MVESIDDRLNLARELLQVARDEFAKAEEAKGRAAVIGLRNACGKGWLAALEATNWYFLMQGVSESQLPENDRGRKYFAAQYMDRSMRRAYLEMRETFHIDGYYDASWISMICPVISANWKSTSDAIEESTQRIGLITLSESSSGYPRRNVSTCDVYSSGFSKGTQWPQLFSSTSRESSRLFRAAIPISNTHIRS